MARTGAKLGLVHGGPVDRAYGVRLAGLLNARRMSVADLAREMDRQSVDGDSPASESALGKILKGQTTEPHRRTLERVAAVLGAADGDLDLQDVFAELLVATVPRRPGVLDRSGGADASDLPPIVRAAADRHRSGPPMSPEDLTQLRWLARLAGYDMNDSDMSGR